MGLLKVLCTCILVFVTSCAASSLDVPEKYQGEWSVTVIETTTFPWWREMKYPIRITVGKVGGNFTDQAGNVCPVKQFLIDEELDVMVFKHCGQAKSPDAISPHYIFSIKEGKLNGQVRTYKPLFELIGSKLPN